MDKEYKAVLVKFKRKLNQLLKAEYCEDKAKLIAEHKRLINKLKSKSGEERAEEAKIQSKELGEMMGKKEVEEIKQKYSKPKPKTEAERIKEIKEENRDPKEKTDSDKIKDIKLRNRYNLKPEEKAELAKTISQQIRQRQPTDAEIQFLFEYQAEKHDRAQADAQEQAEANRYRAMLDNE